MSGELVRLDGDGQINRRTFLRNLAAAGTGVAAINSAVQSVYGKKPDGVPLVYTYDTQGNPRKVRYIPEER
ncbi:MAG: twin-arginine translocation signal domain-containing protein, partial [Halococcoides sp.]